MVEDNRTSRIIESVPNRGVAVLDLDRSSGVITLGGKVVIDARAKPDPSLGGRPWTNRGELQKYNSVVGAVRRTLASSLYHHESPEVRKQLAGLAFIREMHNLGFTDVSGARIEGGLPEHWKPKNDISMRYVYDDSRWHDVKLELNRFAKNRGSS